jgi:lysyl-tRNA synthetase class 2
MTLSFPSDLQASPNLSAAGELGGRVASVGAGWFTLADATHELRLSSPPDFELSPGDLVVVRYSGGPSGFHAEELKSQRKARVPILSGEFQRLRNERGRALRARHEAMRVVRQYFEEEGFTEVETPTFVPSPGLDPHVHSLAPVTRKTRTDYLITSPEFHMKRLLVGGMPRIFQLARCFRAEELGPIHEPEFTLLEWYRAFRDYSAMLADTEELVARVFSALAPYRIAPSQPALARPFARLTVVEAFGRFAKGTDPLELLSRGQDEYFQVFVDQIEPGLRGLSGPTFLVEFPLQLAGLAQRCPHDERFAERFELYVDGVELCNGYGELTCADEQRARFQAELERRRQAGEPLYPLDENFLRALLEGLPPSSGNALGFDRLVALALGLPSIGPTLAFTDQER